MIEMIILEVKVMYVIMMESHRLCEKNGVQSLLIRMRRMYIYAIYMCIWVDVNVTMQVQFNYNNNNY